MKTYLLILHLFLFAFVAPAFAGEIHEAARRGDAVRVMALLEDDPDLLNQPDRAYGYTPLHRAVVHGHLHLVQMLVTLGADINAVSKSGCSPRKLAIGLGKDGIAEFLAARGAMVIEPPKLVYRPILVAAVPPPPRRFNPVPVNPAPVFGWAWEQQGYQHVSSACDECGEPVSTRLGVGDRCPHCRVVWDVTRVKYLN